MAELPLHTHVQTEQGVVTNDSSGHPNNINESQRTSVSQISLEGF